MSARADVRQSSARRGLEIIVYPTPGQIIDWGTPTRVAVPENAQSARTQILDLPEDCARALYEALHRHYGGGEATMTRQDLLAERARVDRLLDALLQRSSVPPMMLPMPGQAR